MVKRISTSTGTPKAWARLGQVGSLHQVALHTTPGAANGKLYVRVELSVS